MWKWASGGCSAVIVWLSSHEIWFALRDLPNHLYSQMTASSLLTDVFKILAPSQIRATYIFRESRSVDLEALNESLPKLKTVIARVFLPVVCTKWMILIRVSSHC